MLDSRWKPVALETMHPAQTPIHGLPWILVVDDDDDVLEVLRDVLESDGYQVVTAQDAVQALAALETARDHQPGIVLLDVMMPGCSGGQLLAIMRRDLRWARLPVVMITASNLSGPPEGANALLRKPFDLEELRRVIRALGVDTSPAFLPMVSLREGA